MKSVQFGDTLCKEDILKAAQEMSKEERLKLIAEIATLPEPSTDDNSQANNTISDNEVMHLTNQFIDKHKNLLRRLAE